MQFACLRVSLISLTFLFISNAFAQEQSPPYLRVDFMKSTATNYTDVESDIWKPLHQDMIKRGRMLSWSLYWVNYGDRHDWDYFTVNVFPTLEATQNAYGGMQEMWARVHPGADMSRAMANTDASREHVGSELWRGVLFEGDQARSYGSARINYMKVPEGGGNAYVTMERDVWAPIHRASIAKGCEDAWGVYALLEPWGADVEYNFAAVNFADEWKDDCDIQALAAEAHPNMEWSAIAEKTNATRALVRGLEVSLIDATNMPMEGSN